MGCQPSIQHNINQQTQKHSEIYQIKISYRQFIRNDVGQVFDIYHFSKIINRSSTSLIRRVVHRVSKIQKICKIVPIKKKQNIHVIKQVQILKNLDHPNIVQLQQYFFDKSYLYIIMEKISGMKLSQFLSYHSQLSFDILVNIYLQFLSALHFCHQKGIVHNSIHPDNILIISKKNEYFLKLIDFSQASVIKAPKITKPNLLKQYQNFRDPMLDYYTNQKNDIWSAAMIFLFMISGQKNNSNFLIKKQQYINECINSYQLLPSTRTKLQDLLLKMFKQNLNQRIMIQDAIKHQFFQEFKVNSNKLNYKRNSEKNFLQRLMKFNVQSQLQSIFWMYASLNILSPTQKCQFATQFYNLDKNKDGKLDKDQIKQSLINNFNLKEQQANNYVIKIFQSIDKNNSQFLQFSQFVMATSLISKYLSEQKLQKIFKQIDANNDGYISQEQLCLILGGLDAASILLKQRKKLDLKQFKNILFYIFQNTKTNQ